MLVGLSLMCRGISTCELYGGACVPILQRRRVTTFEDINVINPGNIEV